MTRRHQLQRAVCAIVLLGVGFGSPAGANAIGQYAESISLHRGPGLNPSVVLENLGVVKTVAGANVQPTATHVYFDMIGEVKCIEDARYIRSEHHFGTAKVNPDWSLNETESLYKVGFEHHGSPNKKTVTHTLKVPLSQIENGPPSVAFDAAAIFQEKLEEFVAQGGSAAVFLREDRFFKVPVQLSFVAWCSEPEKKTFGKVNTMGLGQGRPAVAHWADEITVKYKGDPAVAGMNTALKGHNLGQLNHGQPFALTTARFQPNMPHYTGKCPPVQDPKIRIHYSGNGEGELQFIVKDGMTKVEISPVIAYQGGGAPGLYDFKYPLKARLAHPLNSDWKTLNKSIEHPLSLQARVRTAGSPAWGPWKTLDEAVWKHRCTPQANVTFGGGAGGFKSGSGEPEEKEMQVVPGLTKPAPAKPLRLQVPAGKPPRAN